jgi:hypothetical protein
MKSPRHKVRKSAKRLGLNVVEVHKNKIELE